MWINLTFIFALPRTDKMTHTHTYRQRRIDINFAFHLLFADAISGVFLLRKTECRTPQIVDSLKINKVRNGLWNKKKTPISLIVSTKMDYLSRLLFLNRSRLNLIMVIGVTEISKPIITNLFTVNAQFLFRDSILICGAHKTKNYQRSNQNRPPSLYWMSDTSVFLSCFNICYCSILVPCNLLFKYMIFLFLVSHALLQCLRCQFVFYQIQRIVLSAT